MAESVQVTKYRAFDGEMFDTAEEAETHEANNFEGLLAGLTVEQVRAAISRAPGHLLTADALEKAGGMIAKARRDAGELRRRPKEKTGEPEAGATREPETTSEAA